MQESKALILAKVEASYGVDAAPAAATNAILTGKPSIDIIGKRIDREAQLPYYGKLSPTNIGEGIKIAFPVEVRGAGALPNTPPRIGALIRACNFTETIDNTPGTEFTKYDPNSSGSGESVTLYFYRDGILHKALGCVGTFKLSAKVNEFAKMDFEFTGLYAGTHASDVAFPSPTFGDAAAPPVFRNAAFTLQGYAASIEALNIDIGNAVAPKRSANGTDSGIERYFISGREIKGDCDPEAVALATFNPWTQWDASTAGALGVNIGSASQNRCVISMPSIVPDVIKYGSREGLLTYGYPFTAHPTLAAGNNEISLKFG